ncbi:MAG: LptA/OstA family protein [Candidatus Margulisiibacteriota bacterium]
MNGFPLKLFSLLVVLVMASPLFAQTGNISIDASQFELDGETNTVLATGNVVVTQNDVRMTGRYARYDKTKQIIQLFDGIQVTKGNMRMTCKQVTAYGKEDRIEATGDVSFNYGRILGKAQKARYDVGSQFIELTGSPKAWKDQDQLTGKVILIDLKKQRLTTSGQAKAILSSETLKHKP